MDGETDLLTPEQCRYYAKEVHEADLKEARSFVDNKVFKAIHKAKVDCSVIDAIWVHKWKQLPDGTHIIKSRLCARCFLDPQKTSLPTHSQTASRLTQRLLISVGVILRFVFESWDVGAAFLKGFSFE